MDVPAHVAHMTLFPWHNGIGAGARPQSLEHPNIVAELTVTEGREKWNLSLEVNVILTGALNQVRLNLWSRNSTS